MGSGPGTPDREDDVTQEGRICCLGPSLSPPSTLGPDISIGDGNRKRINNFTYNVISVTPGGTN